MQKCTLSPSDDKLGRLMIRFALPCVLSLLVSALYNIVDQIFIGNSELGDLGNAATGAVFPLFVIAQAFAWWFGDGCAAHLNICQGRRASEGAHRAVGSAMVFTAAAGLVLLAAVYPLHRPLLLVLGASENSVGLASEYLNIILAFFPVFMLANMINCVIRADGSPGWAMAAMLAGAIINIVLDAVFILVLRYGMSGAAWATAIGQATSLAIGVFYLVFKTKTFKLKIKSFAPDLREFAKVAQLGISSFTTQATIVAIATVGNILLKRYGAMSVYGEDIPIAVMAIETKVFAVVTNLVVGIALGCQPIIGFNVGAGRADRVRRLYFYILGCTLAIGVAATLLFELAPLAVVRIFGAPRFSDPAVYAEFAVKLFRIFLMLVAFNLVTKMTCIFFQAAGNPARATASSCVRDLLCFIPAALILSSIIGIEGVLYAAPIADAAAFVLTVVLTATYFASLASAPRPSPAEHIRRSVSGVIVTVAREHGSSGKLVGKRVAEKLGIPFYYKEMIALAAKESGLDEAFISGINKKSPKLLRSLYLGSEPVSRAVAAQIRAINDIADAGSCVIVGRAADCILRDRKKLVRVFVYAPEEYKIKRLNEVYGDDPDTARRNMKRSDGARAAYLKSICGENWFDPGRYDIAVDGSRGIEQCADEIIAYISKSQAEDIKG